MPVIEAPTYVLHFTQLNSSTAWNGTGENERKVKERHEDDAKRAALH
jgi:hypothetical protein